MAFLGTQLHGTKFFVLFLVASILASGAFAQDEAPLITDRPGQSYSAVVIPKRAAQVETAVVFNTADLGDGLFTTDRTFGWVGAVRYGLANRLEVSGDFGIVQPELVNEQAVDFDPAVSSLRIGIRYALVEETDQLPAVAAALFYHPPVFDLDVEEALPQVLVTLSKSYGKWGINPSLLVFYQQRTRAPEVLATLNVSYSVSNDLGVFVGTAFRQLGIPDSRGNAFFECGGTYLLKPRLQLDFDIGTDRLNYSWDGLYSSLGCAFRF